MIDKSKVLGKLFLIPTVISENTEAKVLSPQIIEAIKELDYFLVENLRTARRFISALRLGKKIEELNFQELNKDTPAATIKGLFKPVFDGHNIGVLSEAGCPGVADPGAMAVDFAHRNYIQVVPLVGPSSILLALMASGFSGQSFIFHGYLPIDKAERISHIQQMEKNSLKFQRTEIFMETPYRNNQLFETLLSTADLDTKLCVACDLTSSNELIKTHSIKNWKNNSIDLDKRPTIFLLSKI